MIKFSFVPYQRLLTFFLFFSTNSIAPGIQSKTQTAAKISIARVSLAWPNIKDCTSSKIMKVDMPTSTKSSIHQRVPLKSFYHSCCSISPSETSVQTGRRLQQTTISRRRSCCARHPKWGLLVKHVKDTDRFDGSEISKILRQGSAKWLFEEVEEEFFTNTHII